VEGSDAWACSDFVLLERIMFNLVSNAIRYTQQGAVVVRASRGKAHSYLEVRDTGPGIPQDKQQAVFEEFYRMPSRSRGHRGGMGLGLTIVERLCRLLGHSIELQSGLGEGTCFRVGVPLVARGGTITAETAAADPVEGKLVVVIDDEPLVLDAMGGILRSWGCRVVTAQSADLAHKRLSPLGIPDLIISDYRLANEANGIEAIEFLRHALGASIPAFLVTGDTAPGIARDAEANNYVLLRKPVPPMALRATLNRLLRARIPASAPR
jgi:CheY-like chemotaxis protein